MSKCNFKEVAQPQRIATWYKRLPLKTIRIRSTGISVSKDIVQRFMANAYTRRGTVGLSLKIEIDPKNKAVRLSPHPDGYKFQLWQGGNASLSTLPRDIRDADMPLGEYVTNNQNNVFKFVK